MSPHVRPLKSQDVVGKEKKQKGTPVESLTFGYHKNSQVFNDEFKCSQIYYGLTPKDFNQLAYLRKPQ
ncbi:unnamed protein product [Leptidea sinapis]|uniref:Uncharacterized protein n=1 Tax=Leptidea sinapis TaxID=189913 RepID=A0A5E4PVZ8_9NEOP|nr:unnamed protein product [Leptidea sinapis]